MMIKKCTNCKKDKPLEEYHNQKKGKYGKRASCKVCTLKDNTERNNKNKEYISEYQKQWYKDNKEKVAKVAKEYRKNNPKRVKELRRKKYLRNKAAATAYTAIRKAAKVNATPKWLTEKHKKEIKNIYKQRKDIQDRTGKRHDVHHIIPINQFSDKICGLHVPWNLQILSHKDHLKAHEELRKKWK